MANFLSISPIHTKFFPFVRLVPAGLFCYFGFSFCGVFKGTVSQDFLLLVFFESISPQPKSIPLRPFRIFSKIRGDICKSRCTTGINDASGKFVTGVNNASGKLPPVSTTLAKPVSLIPMANLPQVSTPVANLPPVSLTPVAICR